MISQHVQVALAGSLKVEVVDVVAGADDLFNIELAGLKVEVVVVDAGADGVAETEAAAVDDVVGVGAVSSTSWRAECLGNHSHVISH